ncbi:MAG: VOC family protein [Kangiellaceae bacterium]|nr:VOC family protein [Kangiellaceae bacterium]
MNRPSLRKIDHLHLYVEALEDSIDWYGKVLGFKPISKSVEQPVFLYNDDKSIALALFEENSPPSSGIAFNVSPAEFENWIAYFDQNRAKHKVIEHDSVYSIYLSDPSGNQHELACSEKSELKNRSIDAYLFLCNDN